MCISKKILRFYKSCTKNKRSGKNRDAQITENLYSFVFRALIKAVASLLNCGPCKSSTYQEGLLVANWTQIKKQGLAALSAWAHLTRTALRGEACSALLPSEPALWRSSWNGASTNRTEAFPAPLKLCICIPNSIFVSQSQGLYSDNSGPTAPFGPIKPQGCGVFGCMRMGQSGTRGWGLLST